MVKGIICGINEPKVRKSLLFFWWQCWLFYLYLAVKYWGLPLFFISQVMFGWLRLFKNREKTMSTKKRILRNIGILIFAILEGVVGFIMAHFSISLWPTVLNVELLKNIVERVWSFHPVTFSCSIRRTVYGATREKKMMTEAMSSYQTLKP